MCFCLLQKSLTNCWELQLRHSFSYFIGISPKWTSAKLCPGDNFLSSCNATFCRSWILLLSSQKTYSGHSVTAKFMLKFLLNNLCHLVTRIYCWPRETGKLDFRARIANSELPQQAERRLYTARPRVEPSTTYVLVLPLIIIIILGQGGEIPSCAKFIYGLSTKQLRQGGHFVVETKVVSWTSHPHWRFSKAIWAIYSIHIWELGWMSQTSCHTWTWDPRPPLKVSKGHIGNMCPKCTVQFGVMWKQETKGGGTSHHSSLSTASGFQKPWGWSWILRPKTRLPTLFLFPLSTFSMCHRFTDWSKASVKKY